MTAASPFHLDGGEPFSYRDDALQVGGLPVDQLAGTAGTPLYLYDLDAVAAAYRRLEAAFHPGEVLYSVKANANLALLRRLAALGAGFDVVSGGELLRVLRAGARPGRIVFAGVGKTRAELRLAARSGVVVHVESADELAAGARVALGVLRAGRHAGLALDRLDVGGGLPVAYDGGPIPSPEAFAAAVARQLAGSGARLQVEPGRAVVAQAGALVASVLATKPRPGGRSW